jgi:hypothetical protein
MGEYLFFDWVVQKKVYEYLDKYGNCYMAHSNFFFWGFRVKTRCNANRV